MTRKLKDTPYAGVCSGCQQHRRYIRTNGLCSACARVCEKRSSSKDDICRVYNKFFAAPEHLAELARRAELRLPLTVDPPPGRYGNK
jgi:predicted amidophosphoribosyltransferase